MISLGNFNFYLSFPPTKWLTTGYLNDTIGADYKSFRTTSSLNINNPNKRVEFNIDFKSNFCSPLFHYYIPSTVMQHDGANYTMAVTLY